MGYFAVQFADKTFYTSSDPRLVERGVRPKSRTYAIKFGERNVAQRIADECTRCGDPATVRFFRR